MQTLSAPAVVPLKITGLGAVVVGPTGTLVGEPVLVEAVMIVVPFLIGDGEIVGTVVRVMSVDVGG